MYSVRSTRMLFLLIVLLLVPAFLYGYLRGQAPPGLVEPTPPGWEAVEKVFRRKGTVERGVLRITFQRTDLRVRLGAVTLAPELALTSWIAFRRAGDHVLMVGDLVLLEAEIEPAVSEVLKEGLLKVTALHNHLVRESPRVMFLHIAGQGDPVSLAESLQAVLALTGTPLPPPSLPPPAPGIDWAPVERMLGHTGQRVGNVLLLSVPRAETILEAEKGVGLPPSMGVAHVINLQALGEKSATTGDFVLLAQEVNRVATALQESGITVTAIHNHMLTEKPRLFFLHFWGVDRPEKLARALRLALDRIKRPG